MQRVVNVIDRSGKDKICPYGVHDENQARVEMTAAGLRERTVFPCIGERCAAFHLGVCLIATQTLLEIMRPTAVKKDYTTKKGFFEDEL